jgi:hypothetical protein
MSESEIVWGESPSALAVRPGLADLSPEQRRKAEAQLLVGKGEDRVRESIYQSPGFSKPEVLRLLNYEHAKNGQPIPPRPPKIPSAPLGASHEELLAYTVERDRLLGRVTEATENYMARFRYWASLDSQLKTQLAADAQFNIAEADKPAWSVSLPADPVAPRLIIRAESAALARIRAVELLGLWAEPAPANGGGSPWSVVPYEEPAT